MAANQEDLQRVQGTFYSEQGPLVVVMPKASRSGLRTPRHPGTTPSKTLEDRILEVTVQEVRSDLLFGLPLL